MLAEQGQRVLVAATELARRTGKVRAQDHAPPDVRRIPARVRVHHTAVEFGANRRLVSSELVGLDRALDLAHDAAARGRAVWSVHWNSFRRSTRHTGRVRRTRSG